MTAGQALSTATSETTDQDHRDIRPLSSETQALVVTRGVHPSGVLDEDTQGGDGVVPPSRGVTRATTMKATTATTNATTPSARGPSKTRPTPNNDA